MTIQSASMLIETIAHYYGNGQEKRETADRWVTCCPVHGDHNPSLALELDPKKRYGFGFVCRSRNCDGKSILSKFFADGLIQLSGNWIKLDDRGSLIMPVPITAPIPPPIKSNVTRYRYLNQQGQTLIYVDKIQLDSVKKEFRPLALYTNKDNPTELGWGYGFPKGFKDKPLYGLERFAYDTPFLLCEGEKKVDKAAVIFGNKFVPISYQGGINAFGGTDWSVIPKGSKIIIWPDNDNAAKITITKTDGLFDFLTNKGYQVTIVPVWEYNLPPKWDLADPLPKDWDLDRLWKVVAEAQPLIYFRKSDLNRYCELSITLGNEAAMHSCKSTTEKVCEFCIYKGRFNNPNEFLGLDPLHRDIIIIVEQEDYYVPKTNSIVKAGGLASLYAWQPGYGVSGNQQPHLVLKETEIATRVQNFTSYPGKGLIVRHEDSIYANTWRPWKIRDTSNTRPQMWLDLADHIFTDSIAKDLVIQWLAHTLQHPTIKINYGLLIISPVQGIGKSLFVEPVKKMMGNSARSIDMTTFGTQYTSYLEGLKLLIIEELASSGHLKSNYNKLKTMVSAPPDELEINKKYTNSYNIPNLINVVAFTNKEVPVIMEEYDRRWFVYRSEVAPKEYDFYKGYVDYVLSKEGLDSLYWYLMGLDVSNFNNGKAPYITDAKKDLINESRDPLVADLIDAEEQHIWPFNSYLTTEKDIVDFINNQLHQYISGVKARKLLGNIGYVKVARMQINTPRKTPDQRPVWCRREHFDFFKKHEKEPTVLAKYYLTKNRSRPLMAIIV